MGIKKLVGATVVIALTLAMSAVTVNEAPGRATSGPPTRNFTIGGGQTITWNESFDADPSLVHVQFREFTNMRLEVLIAGNSVYVHDYDPGTFYTCRFALASPQGRTFTIRLTNLGSRTYNGVLVVR